MSPVSVLSVPAATLPLASKIEEITDHSNQNKTPEPISRSLSVTLIYRNRQFHRHRPEEGLSGYLKWGQEDSLKLPRMPRQQRDVGRCNEPVRSGQSAPQRRNVVVNENGHFGSYLSACAIAGAGCCRKN